MKTPEESDAPAKMDAKMKRTLLVFAFVSALVSGAIGFFSATIAINENFEDWRNIRKAFEDENVILVGQELYIELMNDGKLKRLQGADKGEGENRNIDGDATPENSRSVFRISKVE